MTLPYSSVTCPPVVETNWHLFSIRFTNRACAWPTALATRL